MRRSRGLQAMIDERQAAMNDPVTRCAAYMILAYLSPFSMDEKMYLLRERQRRGGGIEYDLAGLMLLKPNAPYGREIEA